MFMVYNMWLMTLKIYVTMEIVHGDRKQKWLNRFGFAFEGKTVLIGDEKGMGEP